MDVETNSPEFVENFDDFYYLSRAELFKTEKTIKPKIELLPLKQIAVFMTCLVLANPVILFLFGAEFKTILILFVAAMFCGCGFVGILWLINRSSIDAKVPAIDKTTDELILPSGTRIAKSDIAYFRQFECKTKTSNFRLVLTSIVTSNEDRQYAVCAEMGRFRNTGIGEEIAGYFGKTMRARHNACEIA